MNKFFCFIKSKPVCGRGFGQSLILLTFCLLALFWYFRLGPAKRALPQNNQINQAEELTVFYKSLAHNFVLNLPTSWAGNYEVVKSVLADKVDIVFYQAGQKKFAILVYPLDGWLKNSLSDKEFVLTWTKDKVFIWQSDIADDLFARIARTFKVDYSKEDHSVSYDVYFSQPVEKDFDCSLVEPVKRLVQKNSRIEEQALNQLLLGPTVEEKKQGYNSWFSQQTANKIISMSFKKGRVYVNLRDLRTIIPGASSSCGSAQFLGQLENTLKQFPTVKQVFFAFDGSPENFYNWLQLDCNNEDKLCDPQLFNN
ncbi:GerMN domain-containing protein [Patescibacteria group bacterium]|nr:GerMN domain-containing protein [Patescibacteria group bacterium]